MHKRIEFVSDKEVRIERTPGNIVTYNAIPMASGVRTNWHKMGAPQDADTVDRQGLEAVDEVISCVLDTGDFAALQDTSAVPFSGKKMRYSSYGNPHPCTVLRKKMLPTRPQAWIIDCELVGERVVDACILLPLVDPKPAVRGYEPWEAVKHLGRFFTHKGWNGRVVEMQLTAITARGVYDADNFLWDYIYMAEKCVWADDRLPCGVEV